MSHLISIIFPAYNEETRIRKSLETTIDYLTKHHYNFEILVVDDGSKDRTIETAKKVSDKIRVIPLGKNMGKGAAVKTGMLEAKGEFRIFSDSDLSTPIYEIEKLLNKFYSGADVCIGSRALNRKNIKEHQPFYRETMGKFLNLFVQIFVFKGITDTQCGFKGFTANATRQIFSKSKINGFSFDVEALYIAQKLNLKVEQVSVDWYNDERSTVNPITDSIRMFIEILKIKKLHKDSFFSNTTTLR